MKNFAAIPQDLKSANYLTNFEILKLTSALNQQFQ